MTMVLDSFHPSVSGWFKARFGDPTPVQAAGWEVIRSGRSVLMAAPTGSGKTLAAFLEAVNGLVVEAQTGPLPDETRVLYVSPLKALGNDIHMNLKAPLAGIRSAAAALGLAPADIRVAVRTGDTPSYERSKMVRRPPHIVVTTPESLYLLLTSDGGRRMLSTVRTVILDEIHAVTPNKRGAHLALSLERLESLTSAPLVRIGLSATQKPIESVAAFLVGDRPLPVVIDLGHIRRLDLALEVPRSPLEAVMAHEVWSEVYDRLAELILSHRTTLVFVNTRRLAERLTRHLEERLPNSAVMAHHGSLSKEQRLEAEQRLKTGSLRAIVATASLELGIDIGSVDLVCQIGATRSVSALLQRVGRSGHAVNALPKGRLFPLTRDELVEAAALLHAVKLGQLDRVVVPEGALDILSQQIVAEVAAREWSEDELFAALRAAHPYRSLARADFDAILSMLAEGYASGRGRRGAYLHRDQVNGRVRARKGARIAATTGGGAIPDVGDFRVVLEPGETFIGTLNEDFAIESSKGDIFQLGNSSWRVEKIEKGTVRVTDAAGAPPTVPFWLGEAPGRTDELSRAVSRIRAEVATRLTDGDTAELKSDDTVLWLEEEVGIPREAALQLVEYLGGALRALGRMPTRQNLVAERFFDEAGNQHMVLHTPFGSRLNRAWGLALRKRFCRKFNFELQAAATEDAILLSLGPTHSFPADDVFGYLDPASARTVLVQALLDAPLFGTRWRWNATRSLAVLRRFGARAVPIQLQRMQSEDLIAVVFPDQLACLENIGGDREIPEHPLVRQTLTDCLTEAMDADGLDALLVDIQSGARSVIAVDLAEPSPLALEVLSAKPYAFLDDAPLEERRSHAVSSRRWLDPETAANLGALDQSAIARVIDEARPAADTPDELHDALLLGGYLTESEGLLAGPAALFETLVAAGRAARLVGDHATVWVATERVPEVAAVAANSVLEPSVRVPEARATRNWTAADAAIELVRGRLEMLGPVTAAELAAEGPLTASQVEAALLALEVEGFVMRGQFRAGPAGVEWCERRLLARIHRYTMDRLRGEIRPVSAEAFMRFLLDWQHLSPGTQTSGTEGLAAVLEQLEGYEAAAGAWETELLPRRVEGYQPGLLDSLALTGDWVWARLRPPASERPRSGPLRTTPVGIVSRGRLAGWRATTGADASLGSDAQALLTALRERGASFFADLRTGSGLLPSQTERALGELAAGGLVTADSFRGLRALLVPSGKRPMRSRGRAAIYSVESAGRWWALPEPEVGAGTAARESSAAAAWALLRRYGVVFRRVIERESALPPWRDILTELRRLEARGEIRGGRFVGGMAGEQYALPEAVGLLRRHRASGAGNVVVIAASDPANLGGVVTPGERIASSAGTLIALTDGNPVAVRQGRDVRFLSILEEPEQRRLTALLAPTRRPRTVHAYL
jgi:ATP-dependent helicase Lhr and Lhr-like helicase